jgi:TPR repeat protein
MLSVRPVLLGCLLVAVQLFGAAPASGLQPSPSSPVAADPYATTAPLLTDDEVHRLSEQQSRTCKAQARCFETKMWEVQALTWPGRGKEYRVKCDAGDLFGCTVVGVAYLDDARFQIASEKKAEAFRNGLALLRKACDGKSGFGCDRLAQAYELIPLLGIPDPHGLVSRAAETHALACNYGAPESCRWIGEGFRDGSHGHSVERTVAASYFDKGCQGLDQSSCEALWQMFQPARPGTTGTANFTPAEAAATLAGLERECAGHRLRACFFVADLQTAGPSQYRNTAAGLAQLEQTCRDGDIGACQYIGRIYAEGSDTIGLAPSPDKARWFEDQARALSSKRCAGEAARACDGSPNSDCDKAHIAACRKGTDGS